MLPPSNEEIINCFLSIQNNLVEAQNAELDNVAVLLVPVIEQRNELRIFGHVEDVAHYGQA